MLNHQDFSLNLHVAYQNLRKFFCTHAFLFNFHRQQHGIDQEGKE